MMRFSATFTPVLLLATAALAAGIALWPGQRAEAGSDLSGTWDASYSLDCSATLTQTDDSLAATVNCGGGLEGTIDGTVDVASGTFLLIGFLGPLPVELNGVIMDDDRISGSVSAPPLIDSGSFSASRDGGGGDLSGDWTLTFIDVFAGDCTVEIEHSGSDVAATLDCENTTGGVVEGTFDAGTGALSLSGPFSTYTDLFLEATVADDGMSISGTWTVDPGGLSGPITATRRDRGPSMEPDELDDAVGDDDDDGDGDEEVDVILDVLPSTGAGPASAEPTTPVWLIAALASAGVLGISAPFAARRRAG